MSAPGKSPRSCEFASDTNTSPAAAKPPTVRKRTISGGLSDGSGTPNPFRVAQNVKRQSENFLKLRANIRKNQSTSVVGVTNADRVLGYRVPRDYRETQARDQVRRALLNDARTHGSIDTVLRLDKLHQTVIARLPLHPVTYLVLGTYAASAALTYAGKLSPIQTPDYYDDFGMLVTFMIVFYVGYCYGRFELMFGQVKQGIRCIFNCCMMARATFKNKESLFHLWRYLNLLHASAYVSLTPTYKKGNLFTAFVEQHALLLDTKVRARFEELAPRSFRRNKRNSNRGSFGRGLFGRGSFGRGNASRSRRGSNLSVADALTTNSMWSACMVWSLEVIGYRYKCGDFSAPIHQQMTKLINELSDALHELELLEYQVLPYIYTHLVSLSCMIYLVVSAFIKGAQCESSEPLSTSIVLPTFAMLLQTITVIGLLEIGAILANPLSPAKEAFAICHLLNFTSANSLSVVSVDSAPAVGGTSEEAKRFTSSTGRGSSDRHATGRRFEGTELPVEDDDDATELRQLLAIQTQQLQQQQNELQRLQNSSHRSTLQKSSSRGASVRNMTNDTPPHKATSEASTDSDPVGIRRCFSRNVMPGLNRLRPGSVRPFNSASAREDDKASPGSPYQHSYLGSSAHSSLRSNTSYTAVTVLEQPGASANVKNGNACGLLDQLDSAPIEALAKVAALQVAQQEELEAQLAEEKGSQSQRRGVCSSLLGRRQSRPTNTGSSRQSVEPNCETLEAAEPNAAAGTAVSGNAPQLGSSNTSAGGVIVGGYDADDSGGCDMQCKDINAPSSSRNAGGTGGAAAADAPSRRVTLSGECESLRDSARSHESMSSEEAFVNTHAVSSLEGPGDHPPTEGTASQKKLLMPVAGFID